MISRTWAMPNKNTTQIAPIGALIEKYANGKFFIDPFAGTSKIALVTNDLDPDCCADFCLDVLDFLRLFHSNTVQGVIFDPPYSPRQVSEHYKKLGRTVNIQTTQASFWSAVKQEIARVIQPSGISITCGWNSNGIGKARGFDIVEILLVAHGGWHNDTIVTVEKKCITLANAN